MNETEIKILELIHKLGTSGILKNPCVEGFFTRDYACDNLGCPSEEYLSYDWATSIPISEDFGEFVKKCNDVILKSENHIVGYIDDEKISITIQCNDKDFNLR